jgi:hypothetical protein
MADEDPVLKGQFNQAMTDVNRRLRGHDTLYKEINDSQVLLGKFSVLIEKVTAQLTGALETNAKRDGECKACKEDLEAKIEANNIFRYKVAAIVAFLVVIAPSVISVIILLGGGSK